MINLGPILALDPPAARKLHLIAKTTLNSGSSRAFQSGENLCQRPFAFRRTCVREPNRRHDRIAYPLHEAICGPNGHVPSVSSVSMTALRSKIWALLK